MNIPLELIVVAVTTIIALLAWILVEIIGIKVRLANYEDLSRRINKLEEHVYNNN